MDMRKYALDFSIENRHYYIPFLYYPIVQLKGDSAIGKSLLVQDFEILMNSDSCYSNSLIIDFNRRDRMEHLKKKSYDYVLIDNADILITPRINRFIFEHVTVFPKTRYVLIGRKPFTCIGHPLGFGTLLREKDPEDGKYYFTVDFMQTV